MRRRRWFTFLGAAAVLWLLAVPARAQELAPAPGLDRAELERAGVTIRAVHITVDNVFDPSNPDEDKALYRWANRVHVRTREQVIEDILLFAPGDVFMGRLLDESARTLRARGFIADAVIVPRDYDPVTNSVIVDVRARDSWSLEPEIDFDRTGGVTEWALGLADTNLFGTGKTVEVSRLDQIDRAQTLLGYSDGNVFGSRVRLSAVLANADDGDRRQLAVDRPFFALDTRWSFGGSIHDELRVDPMYDLSEQIDEFAHEIRAFTLRGGWSRGLIDRRARRWLYGITSEEHRFSPSADVPSPLLLPDDRKFVYPWFGWQRVEDDFRQMTELNDMGRTEDVSLGLNMLATIGFATRNYGSDRDATLLTFAANKGWEPGGPGRLLLLETEASTRREDAAYRNSRVQVSARYYRRNLERHLFSARLSALATDDIDRDSQVLLGGDTGLHGYPIRYQAGDSRVLLSVEQRFFTDWYPWRLFRVGWAVFADAGRVSGRDPRAAAPLGTLYDVGAGLRLTSPRASGRNVVHIDLAFPMNGDPSIDKVQFVVETRGSF